MFSRAKAGLYQQKPSGYFQNVRQDLIDLIPAGHYRILEIGCGAGVTGKAVKDQGKAVMYVGVEISPEAAAKAKSVLDAVHVMDIEEGTRELPYPEGYFDILLLADILEHLVDPWKVLKELSFYIRPGGFVIASVPNIRHARVLIPLLLLGRFQYEEEGILDRGHLRFFTRSSLYDLFASASLRINCCLQAIGPKARIVNSLTLGLLEGLLTRKYIVSSQK